MSSVTDVKSGEFGRLGVMVRTPTEIHVYCRAAAGALPGGLKLRICDQTGRHPEELLDGTGMREIAAADAVYVTGLIPGHLYAVELGRSGPGGFLPLMTAGPVQTPWLSPGDWTSSPSQYYRS